MTYSIILSVFGILMLAGVAAAFVPFLPALPYMLLVAGGFVAFDRFAHLSLPELVILGVIAAIATILDKAFGVIGARWGGASGRAILFGIGGLIIGTISFPPLGGIAGMAIAIAAFEYWKRREAIPAARAAAGSLAGSLAGAVAGVAAALIMLILFIVFALTA